MKVRAKLALHKKPPTINDTGASPSVMDSGFYNLPFRHLIIDPAIGTLQTIA
jgi:hypothetical protein